LEEKDLAELRDALEDLEKAKEAMRQGKEDEARKLLARAAGKLGDIDPEGEQGKAARQLAMLQALKQKLGRSMGGGQPTPASGKRPEAAEKDLQGTETKSKGDRSKGGLSGFRFVPGMGLRDPKSPDELRGLIEEAGRENAEAVHRQRLPRSDAELMRGFYEKLRGEERK
jgi:hypothetical protein